MFWAFCNHLARQTRTLHIRILAVLTSVSLMRKWLKPGRLFCPYFRSDPWSTETLNRNVTEWFVPVMVPYHEDTGFTTEIIGMHTVHAGSATIAWRLPNTNWRIKQWLSWCITVVLRLYNDISILSFWWGRDLADWRPAFRTVRLPSQSPENWWSPLRYEVENPIEWRHFDSYS